MSEETPKAETKPSQNNVISVNPLNWSLATEETDLGFD
jgi:hypothetical protein